MQRIERQLWLGGYLSWRRAKLLGVGQRQMQHARWMRLEYDYLCINPAYSLPE
ncbi:MAG: hypothetical protein ABI068_08290 [Ktedonobacterales bacterium]